MRMEGIGRFHQWDESRSVRVVGAPKDARVAMGNDVDGPGFVVAPEKGVAAVPPELLRSGEPLRCWLMVGGNAVESATFPVVARSKPEDYVFEETQTQRVERLAALVQGFVDELYAVSARWPAIEGGAKEATARAQAAAQAAEGASVRADAAADKALEAAQAAEGASVRADAAADKALEAARGASWCVDGHAFKLGVGASVVGDAIKIGGI